MKKELEKLEFAEGYSKIGELKEGLEKFLISCGNNMTVCYTYSNKLIEIYGGDIMLENIPSQSTMTELLGQPLFEVWQELCSVIDENTKWSGYGILVARIGLTSINIEEVVKPFAVYTQKVIASVS